MSLKECLLVDGHSVIHAWEDLRKLHDQNVQGRAAARAELIRTVSGYVDNGGDGAVVVFDGAGFQGERQDALESRDGFRVIYSKAGETADDVIERLTRRFVSEYSLRVVTADQLEADVIVSAGAFWVSPRQFLSEIEQLRGQLRGTLNRSNAGAGGVNLGDLLSQKIEQGGSNELT